MEEGNRRWASAVLPDELIVEILARLPAKSICRCKSISRAWRALISDPANRRRFAQTLSGLFFAHPDGSRPTWGFIGLSMSLISPPPPGVDTAFSLLPPTCGEMELLDSCNGLLLLRCSGTDESPPPLPFYVVYNPATGEWIALPQPTRVPGLSGYSDVIPDVDTSSAALGFDPSISPHFHVFQLVQGLDYYEFTVQAVEIYSSQTGRWVLRNIECSDTEYVQYIGQMTYFSGFLHFCMIGSKVVSVDTEGQTWRISQVRQDGGGSHCSSICHSQGRLLYVDSNGLSGDAMSVYVLKDHDSEEWEWIFKQSINKPDLFGPRINNGWDYYTAAFHPDSDLIFFYDWPQKRLVSYDLKHRNVHVICTLEVPYFEFLPTDDVHRKFLPYVPLYSGALPSSSLN